MGHLLPTICVAGTNARGDRREGVKDILDAMASGRWFRGASHLAIAEKYGVEYKTVKDWAAEAGRHLQLVMADEDTIREQVIANFETARNLALEAKSSWTDRNGEVQEHAKPDLRNYLSSVELQAKVYGLLDRKQPAAPTEEMELSELVRLLEANGYEVRRKSGTSRTDDSEQSRGESGAETATDPERKA